MITAFIDAETKFLDVGENIHLPPHGAILTDANDLEDDNLGKLRGHTGSPSKMRVQRAPGARLVANCDTRQLE